MKPRRLRAYVRPTRKPRESVLRFSRPLTVEQVRQFEAAWEAKGGMTPVSFEFTTESRKPWWRRWLP